MRFHRSEFSGCGLEDKRTARKRATAGCAHRVVPPNEVSMFHFTDVAENLEEEEWERTPIRFVDFGALCAYHRPNGIGIIAEPGTSEEEGTMTSPKRTTPSGPIATLALAMVVAACQEGCHSDASAQVTRDSAGIWIIENARPADDSRLPWRIGPEPVLSIGEVVGEEVYLLHRANDATVLPDGRSN